MEIIDKHICKTCNKSYSSYSSLWNHNKNIHKTDICKKLERGGKCLGKGDKNILNENNIINYNCRFCNKNYNNKNSRWYHEQKCKIEYDEKEQHNNEIKIAEINKEIKLAEINEKIKLAEINKDKEVELAKINLELKKVEIIASSEAYIRPLGL